MARPSHPFHVLALCALTAQLALAQPSDGVPDWLRRYADASGLAGPAPGEPRTPASSARTTSEPSPYDAGYFTDADELKVPDDALRAIDAPLDRALSPGATASDIRALRWDQVNYATTEEKARLVERAAAVGAREWVVAFFERYRPGAPIRFSDRGRDGVTRPREAEGARTLEVLVRRGSLLALLQADDPALQRLLSLHVTSAAVAAPVVQALLAQDTRARRLAAHRVLDACRAGRYLSPVLAELRGSLNATVRAVAAQASPTIRPEVIAHRADPIDQCENTLPAIRSAAERGADGVEIDLNVTADGRVILWHDMDPGAIVAVMRNVGLEPGQSYRPTWPGLGSPFRRPVYTLTLAEVRANLGYAGKDGAPLPGSAFRIPTWDEAAALLATLPSIRRIVLDIKLPADDPALHARFAAGLRPAMDRYGLRSRCVAMTIEPSVVRDLKPALGPGLAFTHDIEITNMIVPGGKHTAVGAALALGNPVCSVGRPRVPKLGGEYDYYLSVLRADRARIAGERLPLRFITWTINDELEMREVIAIGVDGIITDQPDLLSDVRRRLGL